MSLRAKHSKATSSCFTTGGYLREWGTTKEKGQKGGKGLEVVTTGVEAHLLAMRYPPQNHIRIFVCQLHTASNRTMSACTWSIPPTPWLKWQTNPVKAQIAHYFAPTRWFCRSDSKSGHKCHFKRDCRNNHQNDVSRSRSPVRTCRLCLQLRRRPTGQQPSGVHGACWAQTQWSACRLHG